MRVKFKTDYEINGIPHYRGMQYDIPDELGIVLETAGIIVNIDKLTEVKEPEITVVSEEIQEHEEPVYVPQIPKKRGRK